MYKASDSGMLYYDGEKIAELDNPHQVPVSPTDALTIGSDAGLTEREVYAILAITGGLDHYGADE